MNRYLIPIILGTVALAACNVEPEQVVAGETPDPMAGELASAPPVELPPAIAASKTYRCKDNSLVTIDWLADKKSANLRAGDATASVQLKAAAEGEALAGADGSSLTGNATAASINLTLPGKGALSCKA